MIKQQHLITPPPELVQQWLGDFFGCTPDPELSDSERFLVTRAAQWGADHELEACCGVMNGWFAEPQYRLAELRAARRPKPPSLKQQALEALKRHQSETWCEEMDADIHIIRRALEALPND